MGKPFRVSEHVGSVQAPAKQLEPSASPTQVLRATDEKGITLDQELRAVQVPDRTVGQGAPKNVAGPGSPAPAPVYPDSLPWGPAGPFNDANKKPMKLR